jgi:hypothetical protein
MRRVKKYMFDYFFFHFILSSISIIKVLVDASVHSEHRKIIKCDFKPGSVDRYIDLYQRGLNRQYFQRLPPIKIEQFSSGIHLCPILTVLKTF